MYDARDKRFEWEWKGLLLGAGRIGDFWRRGRWGRSLGIGGLFREGEGVWNQVVSVSLGEGRS